MNLEIIYKDKFYVAINKPHGLLVHPSPIARNAHEFALQKLRNQLGRYVYPIHRIDRKTGGVLLFSLDMDTLRGTQPLFVHNKIKKKYLAIVRGYTEDFMEIDYPLQNENGKVQEAFTEFKTLRRTEIDVPLGKHSTSRYSLLEVYPRTGRTHQIRRHLSHIFHPIIGDRPHGCNKQNRLFKQKWEMNTMMLHARSLQFEHYCHHGAVDIEASIQPEFRRVLTLLGWEGILDQPTSEQ